MAMPDRKVITIGVSAGLVVLIIVGLLGHRVWDSYRRSLCASNLSGIGHLIRIYAAEHGGQYPPDLQAMVTEWPQMSPWVFDCPVGQSRNPRTCYEYIAGQTDSHNLRNVLLYEKPNGHRPDGGSVVYIDRHAEYVTPYSRVLELVKKTKARLAVRAAASMPASGGWGDRE